MDKINILNHLFNLFVNKSIPEYILINYINKSHSFYFLELQDFISNNLKEEFNYLTGYGVIESVELLYKSAVENGNIVEEGI